MMFGIAVIFSILIFSSTSFANKHDVHVVSYHDLSTSPDLYSLGDAVSFMLSDSRKVEGTVNKVKEYPEARFYSGDVTGGTFKMVISSDYKTRTVNFDMLSEQVYFVLSNNHAASESPVGSDKNKPYKMQKMTYEHFDTLTDLPEEIQRFRRLHAEKTATKHTITKIDSAGKVIEKYPAESSKDRQKSAQDHAYYGYLDLMLVYTPEALAVEGSTAAMYNKCILSIENYKAALAVSTVYIGVNMVSCAPVVYTETNFTSALRDLSGHTMTPVYMADMNTTTVDARRNELQADVVHMLVALTEFCGLGWYSPRAQSKEAYSVGRTSCSATYHTLATEIGHNMGLDHDTSLQGYSENPYGYGFCWDNTADDNKSFRSIMSLSTCITRSGRTNGTKIGYFSNPRVNHQGEATGDASHDSEMTIRNNMENILAWGDRNPASQPSSQPSAQPLTQPYKQPSTQPSSQPTSQPSTRPSDQPSVQPSDQPSVQPSYQPSVQPSDQPTSQPSTRPSMEPSVQPSDQPSVQPSDQPSVQPSNQPSVQPSDQPSVQPSDQPTSQPSTRPSMEPSVQPSDQPSVQPSDQPSVQPSNQPSDQPLGQPSSQPSMHPTANYPTDEYTADPTAYHPTANYPTDEPTADPTFAPYIISLPPYEAMETSSAVIEQMSVDVSIFMCAGTTIKVDTGVCNGDTYLRLLDGEGNTVATNDDHNMPTGALSLCSQFYFSTFNKVVPCQFYTLRQGCFSDLRCGANTTIETIAGLNPNTLPVFGASNTSNAQENTTDAEIFVCPHRIQDLSINFDNCGCQGDTYYRLLNRDGLEILSNDDSLCGQCSNMQYNVSAYAPILNETGGSEPGGNMRVLDHDHSSTSFPGCQTYTLRQGCHQSETCSGQTAVTGILRLPLPRCFAYGPECLSAYQPCDEPEDFRPWQIITNYWGPKQTCGEFAADINKNGYFGYGQGYNYKTSCEDSFRANIFMQERGCCRKADYQCKVTLRSEFQRVLNKYFQGIGNYGDRGGNGLSVMVTRNVPYQERNVPYQEYKEFDDIFRGLAFGGRNAINEYNNQEVLKMASRVPLIQLVISNDTEYHMVADFYDEWEATGYRIYNDEPLGFNLTQRVIRIDSSYLMKIFEESHLTYLLFAETYEFAFGYNGPSQIQLAYEKAENNWIFLSPSCWSSKCRLANYFAYGMVTKLVNGTLNPTEWTLNSLSEDPGLHRLLTHPFYRFPDAEDGPTRFNEPDFAHHYF